MAIGPIWCFGLARCRNLSDEKSWIVARHYSWRDTENCATVYLPMVRVYTSGINLPMAMGGRHDHEKKTEIFGITIFNNADPSLFKLKQCRSGSPLAMDIASAQT
jgi:hypothetical protein